jgi:hypothetical protein
LIELFSINSFHFISPFSPFRRRHISPPAGAAAISQFLLQLFTIIAAISITPRYIVLLPLIFILSHLAISFSFIFSFIGLSHERLTPLFRFVLIDITEYFQPDSLLAGYQYFLY